MATVQDVYRSARALKPDEQKRLAEMLLADASDNGAESDAGSTADATARWLAGRHKPSPPHPEAWRQTVGLFKHDTLIEQVNDAGEKLRAAEREQE